MNDVQTIWGRPRKSGATRAEDHAKLVHAAIEIVEREGLDGLTARAVAKRAGTAIGSVYALFGNLENLRLEANAATMRDLRLALTAALSTCRETATVDRLIALATAYGDFARKRRKAWTAMLAPRSVEVPPAIAYEVSKLFGLIEGILSETGRIPPSDVPVAAKALWASVHGIVQLGDSGGLGPIAPGDVPAMVRLLVESSVRGLLAPQDLG